METGGPWEAHGPVSQVFPVVSNKRPHLKQGRKQEPLCHVDTDTNIHVDFFLIETLVSSFLIADSQITTQRLIINYKIG